jgi:hypothetical protein
VKKLLSAAFAALVLNMTAVAADAAEPAKIAFVDTGNTGRSVTAEAMANALITERKLPILVISRAVDLNPYHVVPEANAAALLQGKGIDVSAHRAAQLTANDVRHSSPRCYTCELATALVAARRSDVARPRPAPIRCINV